jgi:hypothetical protein
VIDADEASRYARMLGVIANDLDRAGYAFTGPLRVAAGLLLEVCALLPDGAERCSCGEVLQHPRTGRRRAHCSDPCRKRADRLRNAARRQARRNATKDHAQRMDDQISSRAS